MDDYEKAKFLTEYRELCELHGAYVVHILRNDYSPYAVAVLKADPTGLDKQIQEMMLENTYRVFWPPAKPK